MARPRIQVADEVLAELTAEQAAAVRDGRGAPLGFVCLVCWQRGDSRREPVNVVLWVGSDADPSDGILSLVHASCGPSEVRLVDQWVFREDD